MLGPGKYDAACTDARASTHAGGVILIVFDGDKGNGFSAQLPLHLIKTVPAMLRNVAAEIERGA